MVNIKNEKKSNDIYIYNLYFTQIKSSSISYDDYSNKDIPKDKMINIMVGDLQRIKEYPKKGYQIYQKIPKKVWKAYEQLVSLGYNKHLINEKS